MQDGDGELRRTKNEDGELPNFGEEELPNMKRLVDMPSPEGLSDEENWRGNICLHSVHNLFFYLRQFNVNCGNPIGHSLPPQMLSVT